MYFDGRAGLAGGHQVDDVVAGDQDVLADPLPLIGELVGAAGFTDQVQHLRFSRKASAGVLKPRDFLGVELIAQVRSSMSRAV